jgi:hypothetical protein
LPGDIEENHEDLRPDSRFPGPLTLNVGKRWAEFYRVLTMCTAIRINEFLDFVLYRIFKNTTFRELDLFPSSGIESAKCIQFLYNVNFT